MKKFGKGKREEKRGGNAEPVTLGQVYSEHLKLDRRVRNMENVVQDILVALESSKVGEEIKVFAGGDPIAKLRRFDEELEDLKTEYIASSSNSNKRAVGKVEKVETVEGAIKEVGIVEAEADSESDTEAEVTEAKAEATEVDFGNYSKEVEEIEDGPRKPSSKFEKAVLRFKELEKRSKDLEEDTENYKRENERLKRENENLEKENLELKKENGKYLTDILETEHRIIDLEEDREQLQEENKSLKQEFEGSKQMIEVLNEELKDSARVIKTLEEEKERDSKDIQILEDIVSELQDKVKQFEKKEKEIEDLLYYFDEDDEEA